MRRALDTGARVVLDPAARVRHRRRAFPGPYLAQRWRYRVKTGRLLVEKPGPPRARTSGRPFSPRRLRPRPGSLFWGGTFLLPAAAAYALTTWALSFPIWLRDLSLFPAVPFAFAIHHATYLAGLLTGIGRGVLSVAAR